jgi:peroxiredoxin Q/BCP
MSETLTVGAPAPEFSLPTAGGGSIDLASLKGKAVVLYFYPKDDTPGCTKEAIDFNRLRREFEAAGAVILGASPDSVASHDKFRKKHGLELELAADEKTSMLSAYGVWGQKSMYGKTFMGVARTTVLIDAEGRIARVWDKVKVDGHADEVLAAVKAL